MEIFTEPTLTIEMENGKKMIFTLYSRKAPLTVANFIDLAESGFFNGLTFHRVVKDYVIQGGSSTNSCTGDEPGFTIKGEFTQNGIDTGLQHTRGAISMARDEDFNSAATQFFVVHKDAHQLDGRYAAFGQLEEGYDVLDEIAAVPTLPKEQENKPLAPQVIRTVTVAKGSWQPVMPQRLPAENPSEQ